MILKYMAFWIPMVIIGIINAIIREAGYGGFVNELLTHQISTAPGQGLGVGPGLDHDITLCVLHAQAVTFHDGNSASAHI